jgi:predicted metal-dependent HD superfamily phosphohydrolase
MNKRIDMHPDQLKYHLDTALPELPAHRIEALAEAYTEERRTHHNYRYIIGMIDHGRKLYKDNMTREGWQSLVCMILYHKVVYETGQAPPWNERTSADYFLSDLGQAQPHTLPAGFETKVWSGIIATATHTLDDVLPKHQRTVSQLLDLRLASLASPYETFAANTKAIWGEFKNSITREQYDEGRTKWALKFLERGKIYHTPEMEHLEQTARSNLTQMIGEQVFST